MDLENDAILIIYKDGNILELKKQKGIDYHINYIENEIENNEVLKSQIDSNLLKSVQSPNESAKIFNELAKNGNILLTNLGCNFLGATNVYFAFLPSELSNFQKEVIKNNINMLDSMEYYSFNIYDENKERCASTDFLNFQEFLKAIRER